MCALLLSTAADVFACENLCIVSPGGLVSETALRVCHLEGSDKRMVGGSAGAREG